MNGRQQHFADELGRRLRGLRRSRGITQAELARSSGLHRSTIGAIERGETRAMADSVLRIHGGLGMTPGELAREIEISLRWLSAAEQAGAGVGGPTHLREGPGGRQE